MFAQISKYSAHSCMPVSTMEYLIVGSISYCVELNRARDVSNYAVNAQYNLTGLKMLRYDTNTTT